MIFFFLSSVEENDFDSLIDGILQISGNEFSLPSDQIQAPIKIKRKRIRKNGKSYKRLSTNPALIPALRIFKRDIRRKYGDMMNNVFNSGDIKFVWSFFQEFSTPGIQTVHKTLCDELHSFNEPVTLDFEQGMNLFRMSLLAMPDVIFRITNMKICKRSDCSGSRIIAVMTKEGTMLYNMKMNNPSNNCAIIPGKNEGVEGPNTDVLLTPLDTPINYLMKGVVILNLDHDHRIVSIKIEPIKE